MFWKVRAMPRWVIWYGFSPTRLSREQVERGSLACAVGPDEADQFACVDIHIEVGNGLQAAEHFHDVRGFEKWLIHCLCPPSRNA